MKKIVAVTIVSAFLVFLSLYTVNAVIMGQQKSKLREISQTLLQYSEGLSLNRHAFNRHLRVI